SKDFRASRAHDALARAGGVLLACAGLVVSAPLVLLIALLIKLDSRGPVLFVHERVGLGGRRFRLLKFRTMYPSGGATSEWVRDNESRITRLGRFLRRFRLDELPQFVNILRGDLNLIGPGRHSPAASPPAARHGPCVRRARGRGPAGVPRPALHCAGSSNTGSRASMTMYAPAEAASEAPVTSMVRVAVAPATAL